VHPYYDLSVRPDTVPTGWECSGSLPAVKRLFAFRYLAGSRELSRYEFVLSASDAGQIKNRRKTMANQHQSDDPSSYHLLSMWDGQHRDAARRAGYPSSNVLKEYRGLASGAGGKGGAN